MEIEFKDASNPQAVRLGEIEIRGHRVFVTSDSPQCWRRLIKVDDGDFDRRNTLDQNSVITNAQKTLSRIQSFDVARRFDELAPKVRMLTAKRWKEIHCHDWRFDASLFFAGLAAKALRIERPTNIKFFRQAKYGETATFEYDCDLLRGMASQGTGIVWIHEGLAGTDFIETTAHECRHLWQPRAISDEQKAANERDALAWGERFAARFKTIIPPRAELYVLPRFHDFDADFDFDSAPAGSWLFHPDGRLFERKDFRWWQRSNWEEMQNGGILRGYVEDKTQR